MSNIIPIRDRLAAASMVQIALDAIGRNDRRKAFTQAMRDSMGEIRAAQRLQAEIDAQVRETGADDYTVGQDAAYTEAERIERTARGNIRAWFADLTEDERQQLRSLM
jgi:hypothetical protein